MIFSDFFNQLQNHDNKLKKKVKNHIIFPLTMGTWGSGFGHVFCTEAESRKMVKWILLLEGVGRKCYYMQANKKLKASWAPFSIVNFLSKAKKKSEKSAFNFFYNRSMC
jgi:hypothetical protein